MPGLLPPAPPLKAFGLCEDRGGRFPSSRAEGRRPPKVPIRHVSEATLSGAIPAASGYGLSDERKADTGREAGATGFTAARSPPPRHPRSLPRLQVSRNGGPARAPAFAGGGLKIAPTPLRWGRGTLYGLPRRMSFLRAHHAQEAPAGRTGRARNPSDQAR